MNTGIQDAVDLGHTLADVLAREPNEYRQRRLRDFVDLITGEAT
jgi:hypothetical protein